jgi:enoyl-CoA hydratase/carnithine racemase
MASMSRLRRSLALTQSRVNTRWRRSTKAFRDRRRLRLAAPPATRVESLRHGHGVFEIRLVGGDRRNVLGRSTIDQLELLVAGPPDGTKVIVITAELPDFCAGYDLVEASRGAPEELIAYEDNFATLRRSTVPIVVAVQGNVIGGGLELALSADIRLASPEATFSIPAAQLGLVYSEAGIRLVVESMGESVARALFLGGRSVSAESALSMGIVTEVVGREQLRDRAISFAASIATTSDVANTGNRQILDVVAGRIVADTTQLRLDSFAPDGDLSQSIARFVARRRQSSKPLVE